MDLMLALTAANQTLDLVRGLREIERGINQGELKAAMAQIYENLSEFRIALSQARETIHAKEQRIRELETKIAALSSGERCPICGEGRLKVISARPHPVFGTFGQQERTLKCSNCEYSEVRKHNPRALGSG